MDYHLYNRGEQTFNSIKPLQKGNSYVGSRQAFLSPKKHAVAATSLHVFLPLDWLYAAMALLSIVGWFFLGLAVIFLIGNAYVMFRMTVAQSKLEGVAAQLDYRPDGYSNDYTVGFDPNPFFPLMGSETQLLQRVFSTPLSPVEVQTRLTGTNSTLRKPENSPSGLLINTKATVDGVPAQELKAQGLLSVIPRYCWRIGTGARVCLHETAILERTIEIRGKEFTGNVIELRIIAVRTQLWTLPGLAIWKRMYT